MINFKKYAVLTAILAVFFLPGILLAKPQTHDGLFIRFQGGVGAAGSFTEESSTAPGNFQEYTPAYSLISSFQIGRALFPNWIIYGGLSRISGTRLNIANDFGAGQTFPPNLLPSGSSPRNVSYSISALTIGISLHIQPANFYISPEYRFASRVSIFDEDSREDYIFAGQGYGISLGKEWWVDEEWGLGIALSYHQDSYRGNAVERGKAASRRLNNPGKSDHAGILFSVTYN